MKAKTLEAVKGFKTRCPDFSPCPLCYGCRNYDPSYYKCATICKGTKFDVCNKEKHTEKALGMMIRPPKVEDISY